MSVASTIPLQTLSWEAIREQSQKADDKNHRLMVWVVASIAIHAAFLLWMSRSHQQMMLDAETYSAPIAVEMVFDQPAPVQKRIVKKQVTKTPAPQKTTQPVERTVSDVPSPEQLNQAAPSAGPMVDIPVVKTVNLKGKRIHPTYPKRALQMKQEGTVWLRVLVSETGAREKIQIHKASPYALLNHAALKAVRKWRFEPTIVKSRAIKSWVEIPIEFKIKS